MDGNPVSSPSPSSPAATFGTPRVTRSDPAGRHPFNVALGAELAAVRRCRGLTQHAAAVLSGGRYSGHVLSCYETGERGMRIATLADLCRLYDTPMPVVLHRAEERLATADSGDRRAA